MLRSIAAASLVLTKATTAVPAPAQADMTLDQFRNYMAMPGGDSLLRSYLAGLRDGIVELQDVLEEDHDVDPTFCPAGDELHHGTRFEEVLFAEIAEPTSGEPWPEDIQMSRLVTEVLQVKFPCRTY